MIARLRTLVAGYDRRLWTLFVVQMIVSAGFGAAMPFVSLYFYRVLGVPMRIVGTIMLVSAGVSAAGRIIGGELSDRLGRRPLIASTLGIRTLLFLGMAGLVYIKANYLVLALIFLLVRFAGAVSQPALSAMVADIVPAARRVEAFGVLRIGGNAGWAIGPALGGFLISISYSLLFVLTAAATGIGMVLILLFTTESIKTRETERFVLRQVLAAGRDRKFLLFCLFSLSLFLVMGQFASTLSVFSTTIVGITDVQLGFLYTLNGIVVVLLQWPAARVARRVGIRRALIAGSLFFAGGYFFVGLAHSYAILLLLMIVITTGEVLFSPSATTAVANMSPPDRTGRYMGFFGLAESLGWSAGPFIGGFLFDAFAHTPMILWGSIAGLGLIAAAGFAVTGDRGPGIDMPGDSLYTGRHDDEAKGDSCSHEFDH